MSAHKIHFIWFYFLAYRVHPDLTITGVSERRQRVPSG
jgi:hypothetical protein